MNSWISIKVSGAACLIALGQLHAGQIESSCGLVSPTPATIFAAAPAAREIPFSLFNLGDDSDRPVRGNSFSDSFDESILQRGEYNDKSVFISDVDANGDSLEVLQPDTAAVTPLVPKFDTMTIDAPTPERKLTTRPDANSGSLFFQLIVKSIVVAGLVMGLKQMIENLNVSPRVEQNA